MKQRPLRYSALFLFFLAFLLAGGSLAAQEEGRVQIEKGAIRAGENYFYNLPDLQKGQVLSVYLRGTSGNLDPIMGLIDDKDVTVFLNSYKSALKEAATEASDPLLFMQEAANDLFLIWDDDGGDGLAARFSYEIPADGDYQLVISDAITVLGRATAGDYELLLGLDAPQVLEGDAAASGEPFAVLDRQNSALGAGVEAVEGTLSGEEQSDFFDLYEVDPGDAIHVHVEVTSGDWQPALMLLNYADKPVAVSRAVDQESQASLDYLVEDIDREFAVQVSGCCSEDGLSGDYRLVVGINAPEVLIGEGVHNDERVIKEPIPVAIGVKMQQIVDVNEEDEFFTLAASMQMEWEDPALAFSPDECNCTVKTYTDQNFGEFIADSGGRWPDFTLFDQQGNRWTQNRNVVVWQDGHALYFERFTTNLQVDFDFRKYPFDSELFRIRIDAIFPETFYYFTDLAGFSEISSENGEDEFIFNGFETIISSVQGSTQSTSSRFTFQFGGPRHLDYYVIQIFVPVLLIMAVLWVTFFLRDYALRIEIASANLLVFIAFSFSLADNHPRLGYITLLDAVMVLTFILSALVIVYNVYLRRLDMVGEEELANRIDNVFDWLYPSSIILGAVILYFYFF